MPTHKPLILVVDDDVAVRRVLRRCFETESYLVSEAGDSAQTLEILKDQPVDLITLDINLDGEDGLQLARTIRGFSAVPIIMVSGKGELIDTVVGLEVGADDYITKPFELREVLARVKSALRRSMLNSAPVRDAVTTPRRGDPVQFRFAGCTLCTRTRDLQDAHGNTCELTTAEYKLLEALLRHPHQVMSRDQIMDMIKGTQWNPSDRTIDNQVARLRRKLESIGAPSAIKTIRGSGYQFTLEVDCKTPVN
ncbi:MAG: response regulator transcription factor [Granulosicoccus sp.]|nr:response regulator transcription factor [Granulosicoccus sp.]